MMKTIYFGIVAIVGVMAIGITLTSCFVLFDAHAQDCMGGQFCGGNVLSTTGNRNVMVSLNFHSNSTMPGNIHYLWLRFFDEQNNTLIKNVSFFVNATKDDKVLMHELFYTKTGLMLMKFYPTNDTRKLVINGTIDPVLGGWMSENDTLPITTSVFAENGTYHIHLEALALVNGNELVDQSNRPTFDFWWSVDNKGNISKYNNPTTISFGSSSSHFTIKDMSPLQQFKSGIAANDVKCEQGLQLVIQAEDGSPACVKSQTAQKLFERGWAQSVSKKSFISIIESSTYLVGQPINATVNYTGYMNGGLYPDVKILNADNGNKVWSNCLYSHTELPSGGGIGTATYDVQCFDNYPVINETGNYIMVASVNNDTTSAKFTIVKPSLSNKILGLGNDTGIVTFGNRTYYFETPHYTNDAYVNPVSIPFHGVVFTLFPPGFKGGLPTNFGGVAANGCGGSYFWTDAKFPDGTHVLLNIFALTTMSQQCLSLPSQTYFSTHVNPQAGLTFYDGKMKLLVSTDGQASKKENATLPISFGKCDTPFSQSNTGVAVLYLPENSTGKICVRYYNLNNTPIGVGARIFEANDLTQNAPDITVSASNNTLQGNENTTIVYSIKTGNKTGLYGFSLTCGGTPLAVGYDANSNLTVSDFPWVNQVFHCFMITYDYHIEGTEGIGVRYIPNP